MKKSRTVYILFFLALVGMTVFFSWKYISNEKVSSSSLPLVKISFSDDAEKVVRNVWTENCNVRIYDVLVGVSIVRPMPNWKDADTLHLTNPRNPTISSWSNLSRSSTCQHVTVGCCWPISSTTL